MLLRALPFLWLAIFGGSAFVSRQNFYVAVLMVTTLCAMGGVILFSLVLKIESLQEEADKLRLKAFHRAAEELSTTSRFVPLSGEDIKCDM